MPAVIKFDVGILRLFRLFFVAAVIGSAPVTVDGLDEARAISEDVLRVILRPD
jgi:hypothetical protein